MSEPYLYYFNTPLQPRQSFTLFDPLNPTNMWAAKLNPAEAPRTPGNVRKYTQTTNGGAVILGDREYPPKEIQLTWNQMDAQEFQKMAAFCNIAPVVLIDNRNNGHLGVLTITNVGQVADVTMDIFAVKASFLVLAPYNGNGTTLNTLTPPTLTATLSSNAGVMPNPATVYLWPTVFTNTGESAIGEVTEINNTNPNAAYDITFTAPTSTYYRKLRIYWNSTNDSTTATLLTEIQNGFPVDDAPSFTVWSKYIPYNTQNPPLYGSAFTGYWAGSYWVQDT
jgi:hypothetical protein